MTGDACKTRAPDAAKPNPHGLNDGNRLRVQSNSTSTVNCRLPSYPIHVESMPSVKVQQGAVGHPVRGIRQCRRWSLIIINHRSKAPRVRGGGKPDQSDGSHLPDVYDWRMKRRIKTTAAAVKASQRGDGTPRPPLPASFPHCVVYSRRRIPPSTPQADSLLGATSYNPQSRPSEHPILRVSPARASPRSSLI